MKKILLVISLFLLVPSYSIVAQAATPTPDAAPSAWLGWFKNLRRPTRQDALSARQYMQSKWRCMVRGEGCSKRQRNALRALGTAIAVAVGTVVGKGVASLRASRAEAAAASAAADAFRAAADAYDAADADDATAFRAAAGAFLAVAPVFPKIKGKLEQASQQFDNLSRARTASEAADLAFQAAHTSALYAARDAADRSAFDAAMDAADGAEAAAADRSAFDAAMDAADDAEAAAKAAAADAATDLRRAEALRALADAFRFTGARTFRAVAVALEAMGK